MCTESDFLLSDEDGDNTFIERISFIRIQIATGRNEAVTFPSRNPLAIQNGAELLLPTSLKRKSQFFNPPMQSKCVIVPSSMNTAKEAETTANPLYQNKDVRLETKEAKKGTSADLA